jgi:hypothetical protein
MRLVLSSREEGISKDLALNHPLAPNLNHSPNVFKAANYHFGTTNFKLNKITDVKIVRRS